MLCSGKHCSLHWSIIDQFVQQDKQAWGEAHFFPEKNQIFAEYNDDHKAMKHASGKQCVASFIAITLTFIPSRYFVESGTFSVLIS